MSSVYIFNDTSYENHFGCGFVMETIRNLVSGFSIVKSYHKPCSEDILTDIEEFNPSLVIVNAEGTFHSDSLAAASWLDLVSLIKKKFNSPVLLINTSWFNNERLNSSLFMFDKIYCREILTYENILSLGYMENNLELMCDLSVFSMPEIERVSSSKEVLVGDSVKYVATKKLFDFSVAQGLELLSIYERKNGLVDILNLYRQVAKRKFYKLEFFYDVFIRSYFLRVGVNREKFLERVSKSGLIVTGRFHQVMFCLYYRVPFIVISSNSPKIESVLLQLSMSVRVVKGDIAGVINEELKEFSEVELEAIDQYFLKSNFVFSRLEKDIDICTLKT